jgi:hypothetical protein
MQGGCKSLRGLLRGIGWVMFHGHWDCFQKPSLGGRPDTKSGDHGTPNVHKCWFILIYHVFMALQAISLVEKAEPVQVRFTLRLRDRQSM